MKDNYLVSPNKKGLFFPVHVDLQTGKVYRDGRETLSRLSDYEKEGMAKPIPVPEEEIVDIDDLDDVIKLMCRLLMRARGVDRLRNTLYTILDDPDFQERK